MQCYSLWETSNIEDVYDAVLFPLGRPPTSMSSTFTLTHSTALLICKEAVRAELALKEIINKNKIDKDAPISSFRGEDITLKNFNKIEHAFHSPSLFSKREVIVIKNGDKLKSELVDKILATPIEPLQNTLLLIIAPSLKSNSRLKKHFTKYKALIEIPEIKKEMMTKWIAKRAKHYQNSLSPQAAHLLLEISDYDIDTANSMLYGLSLYCEKKGDITKEHILTLYREHPDPNEYELLERALGNASGVRFQKELRDLLLQGKNPFLLLGLLGKTISRLLALRLQLDSGTPEGAMKASFKGPGWLFSKQVKLARKFSTSHLEALLHQTVVSDSRLKGKKLSDEFVLTDLLSTASKVR